MTSELISVGDLARAVADVRVFDLRWSLTDPDHGALAYLEGHIPGAVFVDLDHGLAGTPGEGRHPLPRLADFAATLGRLGLTGDSAIVVYDDMSGAVAARMWWMLKSIGHAGPVRLLDGGLQAWVDADLPLETGAVTPRPAEYPEITGFSGVVGHEELEGRVVADARSPERYRGEIEPVDPKAGHIPGAINYPIASNLEDGLFRDSRWLSDLYRAFPDDGVVSCGSGVNACHTALALVVAGRPLPDVYVGSFSDWSRRDLPVATGPNP